MSSPSPSQSPVDRPMRATPVIAGSLSGFILLAVCIVTVLLLRRRRDRLRAQRALRMVGLVHSDGRSRAVRTTIPPDPVKPDTPPLSPRHRHHEHSQTHSRLISPPSPSHPRPSSSSRSRINIQLRNRPQIRVTDEDNNNDNNNRIRGGRTSNSDVILALEDADVGRLDGNRAVEEGSVFGGARTVTRDETDGRVLLPPLTDTRQSSRRTNGSTIPSLAMQSPTEPPPSLLYPTYDSYSTVSSSTSFPPLSLFLPSSSPTLPSSSSSSSKHLSPTMNHERIILVTRDDDDNNVPNSLREYAAATVRAAEEEEEGREEAVLFGPGLKRGGGRGEEDAPPAYENV